MAGVDSGESKGRDVNRNINMIPFIDLLMVTIAFLLITAVWVSFSRMNANAQVPGTERGPHVDNVTKTLHVRVTETDFVLSWKHGSTVVSETSLPRPTVSGKKPQYRELAKRIAKEWANHGGHTDPADRRQDNCVLHTPNDLPFKDMIAVMDAIYHAKRAMLRNGKRERVSVFNVALAAR